LQRNDLGKLSTTPGTADAAIAATKPLAWTTSSQDLNQDPVIETTFFRLVGVATPLKPV
jgi:hypothetical protein